MSISPRSRRGSILHRRAAVAAVAAMLLALLTSVASSQADVLSPFDIDGDVPDVGAVQFPDGHLGDRELGPKNGATTKLSVIHDAAKPMLATTNPNGQVDLSDIWMMTETDDAGDSWLYFAFQRDSATGSGVVMYEFQQDGTPAGCDYSLSTSALIAGCNPWENRQDGDFVLVFDQQGQTVTIYLRYFTGDPLVLGELINLTELGEADAMMSADGFRGEAAVNLSDTIFPPEATSCLTIGNIIPGTVTGNSDTADYKDTVLADFTDHISITNCGSVRITKDTDPDGLSGTFPYTLSRTGGEQIRFDGTLQATGTLTEDGDSELQINLVAGSGYTLAEGAVGPEFALSSIVCDGVNVFPDGGAFAVAAGETSECLITNAQQPGTLVVEKNLVNDDGGTKVVTDFSYTVNGGTAVTFEADGSNSQSVPPGTYTVVEVEEDADGYTTTYSTCTDVVVLAGGTATCTITNDDQPGTLIVQKVLINDNGGAADYDDFSWSTDGDTTSTPFVNGDEVSTEVNAGTYTVTEPEANTMGYTTSYSTCADLVIPNGGSATCVITNDDAPASPTGSTVQSWVLHDSLAIDGLRAGAPDAGSATATFRVYSDATCETQVGSDEAVAITAGAAATVAGVTVTESGFYFWTVEFSGDQFNDGFTTDCGQEVTRIQALDDKDGGRDDFAA